MQAIILSALLLADLQGSYRVSEARSIWIGPFVEMGPQMFFLDSATGRFGPLHPASPATFISGPTIGATPPPADVTITFNDPATELTYAQSGAEPVTAKKVARKAEVVRFSSGGVKLAGKITAPATKGRHAAIVLIHGSGPEDRDYLDPWVDFFVRQGLVVLSYDKRGVRESGGDWKRATFDDLASDALAGVKLLAGRADVDARKIGLFGISQGGWIAPIIVSRTKASRTKSVAFIILHAGSALPVGRNGLLAIEAELRAYGFPEEEVARAIAYYTLNDEVTRTGRGWDELQEAYRKSAGAEWILEEPQPMDHWFRQLYRPIMDFDPTPLWKKTRVPVLAFFGEVDRNVPAELNKAALEAALKNNKDVTTVLLPKANHTFLNAVTGVRTEYPQSSRFVSGYFDVMAEWLKAR